jgi:hypothetical protein
LFFVLEPITGSVLEPWLYGQSAGVSQVALLIALTFWTWLWGPVGLLMATPLTVCLMVLGKHLPALGFIVVLMGDRPVIDAKARYYQRLLARDQDEALDIVEAYVDTNGRESVYDTVLLPALYYANQDRDRGLLREGDAQFVGRATREILDVLAHDAPAAPDGNTGEVSVIDPDHTRIPILGCPARDEADASALEMVQHLLDPAGYRIEVSGSGMLTAEVVAWVDLHRPAVVCIGAVAPGGLSQARHLCKRLRSFAVSGAQDRGRSLGSPRRKGYRSPAFARGRGRLRRDDDARYTTDTRPGGAHARSPLSGVAADARSRHGAVDRPDDAHGARAWPRRVTGIVNGRTCRCAR